MKTSTIFLIYLLSTFYLYGQNENKFKIKPFEPDSTDENCLNQIAKAKEDFESNHFVLDLKIILGEGGKTFFNVLKEDYNVVANYPQLYFENCYNFQLIKLLNAHYGFDVIRKAQIKADSLDKIGLGFQAQKSKFKNLKGYLIENLNKKDWNILKKRYRSNCLWVNLKIYEDGSCYVIRIDIGEDSPIMFNYENRIIEPLISNLIDGKILYEPRIENGKPVQTEETWSVPF